MLAPQRAALLLPLIVSTLQLHDPSSCHSAISPLCGLVQTSQHILSAAETGRNPSAETHLQEGKRSQLLTSPCFPNVTAADSRAEELQTSHHQNPGERSSNGLFLESQRNPLGEWSPTVTAPVSQRCPSHGVSAESCCFGFGSGVWSRFWSSGPHYLIRCS